MEQNNLQSHIEATDRKLNANQWAAAAPGLMKLLAFSIFALPALCRAQGISLPRYFAAFGVSLVGIGVWVYALISPWVEQDPMQGAVRYVMNQLPLDPIPYVQPVLNGVIGVVLWMYVCMALHTLCARLVQSPDRR
ncbi:hypothetical protein [Cupriavidus sp. IK-TO18]|uniref:hypothetical protein n=1 Tax=Cupriavidus sp. IK-TO18 TaxID=2782182 RepID=UPI0018998357|nr:hypothetical protein [Cupriavidus sp. IK-TO18]MBF6989291.1 hypothetical protein [Cupriavidus sp. IK-TO18]